MGNVYLTQGQMTEAERAYKKAIALDPDLAGPHRGLANIHQLKGQPAEAEEERALHGRFSIYKHLQLSLTKKFAMLPPCNP